MAVMKVTVVSKEEAVIDTGDLPFGLVRDMLTKRKDGTFDGNYSLGDLPGQKVEYTTESVEVEDISGR